MLEGQVAALSSGRLPLDKVIATIKAIYSSRLYRKNQNSFILYPSKEIVSFLNKNIIPKTLFEKCSTLKMLIDLGDTRIVNLDAKNNIRFNPDLKNELKK